MTPQDVLALCRERGVKAIDLRFMDFPGLWQHFTIPVSKLEMEVFEDGLGFDGSSIRGWQAINESDMLLVPSNPRPSSKTSISSLLTGMVKCCHSPGKSMKRRSTAFTPRSRHRAKTSLGVTSFPFRFALEPEVLPPG